MHYASRVGLACVVLLFMGLIWGSAAMGASAVEDLAKRMPDDVIAFVGTSGSDILKGDFEKTIVGRTWNDPGVREFYRLIKAELVAKAGQNEDSDFPQKVNMVLDYIRLALSRPAVVGVMPGPPSSKMPITVFAILDAGDRKDQLVAIVDKLESMAGRDEISDKEIGSLKMRGVEDSDGTLLYWGWAGDRFTIVVNDAPGAAVKYLVEPRAAAPDRLSRVSGSDDAFVAYGDVRRIGQLFRSFLRKEGSEHDADTFSAALATLGLGDIKSFTLRAGFVDADVSSHILVEMPAPKAGVLAVFKPVDTSWLRVVDSRAMWVNAANCDLGALYDAILGVVKMASPDEAYPNVQRALSNFESQTGVRIREELLASLAGPMVLYSLPPAVTSDVPTGGGVLLVKLKDAAVFEKSLSSLGRLANEKAEGQIQISTQKRDGRIVHSWTVGVLAMMGIMPTWSIAEDQLILGSNMQIHDLAAGRLAAGPGDARSLLDDEGYKKVAAGLPKDVATLTYTDSQAFFNLSMLQIQQVWPMVTMTAMKDGIRLPVMLPSLTRIAADMGPSINYNYIGPDGFHSVYRGPGFENNQLMIAGGAMSMGVLMPALARTRQLAFRMTSGTNLSSIGRACLIYADGHDDRLPPDLQTLVTEVDLPPNALESKLKPEGFDGPSYIYIPGQDILMHPGNVLAYDNPEFCTEGVNVLFLDTHVDFMKPEAFRQAMEATCKRLNRGMPEIQFQEKAGARPRRVRPVAPGET